MKTTINLYDFRQAFHNMGRGEQFSYDGLGILFDYLEQLGDDIGEEIDCAEDLGWKIKSYDQWLNS